MVGLLATAGACDGDGSTGPDEDPTMSMALSGTALTLEPGQNGTLTINITRGGGFSGVVALTAEGAPAGLKAAFAPASVPGSAATSTLTLRAPANLAPGNYPVTVRATGTGVEARTATVAVTVNPTPSITLAVNPTAVSVVQGENQTTIVTITRVGSFAGPVNLTLTGVPAGVTGTFAPVSIAAGSTTSALTLAAAANAGPITTALTVRAQGQGVADQTAAVDLTVPPAPPSGGKTIAFTFCPLEDPPFFAAQNGNGAWQRITGVNGVYVFQIDQRGGVAWAEGQLLLNVYYATATELTAMGGGQCLGEDPNTGGKTLSGTVAGLTGQTDQASITLGASSATAYAGGSGFILQNVQDGPLDLIATRGTFDTGTFTFPVDKFIIRRNLNLANNAAIPILDFGSVEAFDPVKPALTVNNLGTDQGRMSLIYTTANNEGLLGFGTGMGYLDYSWGLVTATGTYPGIPAAKQAAGDLHLLTVITTGRGHLEYFTAATDRTVALGPALSTPTVTVLATTPYPRFRVQLPKQAEYDDAITVTFFQESWAVQQATITATAGYFDAGFTTWDVTMPDLTDWSFAPGPLDWTVRASGYTGVSSLPTRPAAGAIAVFASRSGTITQ